MENTTTSTTHKVLLWFTAVMFVALSVWYLYIHSFDVSTNESTRQAWGSTYQIVALFGGIVGLTISRKWGGHKSMMGKATLWFSLGLLLQTFGQSVNSYYNYFQHQSIPYPSLGDIGFMGSVFAYIFGAHFLLRTAGFKFSFKSTRGKFFAVFVPALILGFSYFYFLKGYLFDWSTPIKIFLDFGYPLGQAVYLSIACLAYLSCRTFLGGVMKKPLLFLIIALVMQYFSDFTFLYQANAGTWYVGGLNDFFYFVSYLLMTVSLLTIGSAFDTIKNS